MQLDEEVAVGPHDGSVVAMQHIALLELVNIVISSGEVYNYHLVTEKVLVALYPCRCDGDSSWNVLVTSAMASWQPHGHLIKKYTS